MGENGKGEEKLWPKTSSCCKFDELKDTELKVFEGTCKQRFCKERGAGGCCGEDRSRRIRSSLPERGLVGHCGRVACLCWRV